MRKFILAGAMVCAAGLAQAAELSVSHCKFPDSPLVPAGASASDAEMAQAGADVRDYVSGVQSSLECLTAAEESLGDDITDEQQDTLIALYNAGVDGMNAVAEQYNEEVRVFKSR